MNADYAPALGASVFLSLIFEEFVDSVLFHLVEIFNHAHSKLFPVTAIQTAESIARKIATFKTKSYLTIAQSCAMSFKERTVFVTRTTPDTMNDFTSFPRNIS
jgi:uncharacterized membrane protein